MKTLSYLTLLLFITNLSFGQNGKFTELSYKCQDGKERPFIIYTPNSLSKDNTNPLLVYLHGGIANPNLKKDPLAYMKKSKLVELADEGKFYLLFSYGQQGATWFDAVGTDMLLQEIKIAQQKFNLNPNKIFLSGFSDGGSGVFFLSMTKPLPFAGFIAMNGSIAVAQKLGKRELYPKNMNNRPMYIINTTRDMLYPLNQIIPTIEYLKKHNPNIRFKTPKANHEMSYLEEEKADLIAFIQKNTKPDLKQFSWETNTSDDTIQWLSALQIDTLRAKKEWHQPYQLAVFSQKAKFGLKYDYQYKGKGLKVSGFKSEDCTAKKMGVAVNDIILMVGQDSVTSPYTPFYYLSQKKAGDSTSLTVLRGDEEKILKGKFNEGFFYKVFDSANTSGKVKVLIKDKILIINTSRIAEFTIDFDKLKPLGIRKIMLNDKPLHIKKQGMVRVTVD